MFQKQLKTIKTWHLIWQQLYLPTSFHTYRMHPKHTHAFQKINKLVVNTVVPECAYKPSQFFDLTFGIVVNAIKSTIIHDASTRVLSYFNEARQSDKNRRVSRLQVTIFICACHKTWGFTLSTGVPKETITTITIQQNIQYEFV